MKIKYVSKKYPYIPFYDLNEEFDWRMTAKVIYNVIPLPMNVYNFELLS